MKKAKDKVTDAKLLVLGETLVYVRNKQKQCQSYEALSVLKDVEDLMASTYTLLSVKNLE